MIVFAVGSVYVVWGRVRNSTSFMLNIEPPAQPKFDPPAASVLCMILCLHSQAIFR